MLEKKGSAVDILLLLFLNEMCTFGTSGEEVVVVGIGRDVVVVEASGDNVVVVVVLIPASPGTKQEMITSARAQCISSQSHKTCEKMAGSKK